jgi:transcriptional regulator of aromatic amino acid metabolism
LLVLKNALEQASLRRENERFREIVGDAPRMIGSSPAFRHAVEQASRVAKSDARVLLFGESGTGKELLAAFIHSESPFSSGPFVKVNCAAIPTDLLESELFGHEKALSQARPLCGVESSSLLMAEQSFSTRSATSRNRLRRNCCASCRKVSSSAWAVSVPSERTSA